MKLIIDIDEKAYNGCVKLKNNDDMGILGFHLINATANGIPLEDIKAEIEEEKLDVDLDIGNETIYNNAINDVLEILDKHIKENKQWELIVGGKAKRKEYKRNTNFTEVGIYLRKKLRSFIKDIRRINNDRRIKFNKIE